MQSQHQKSFAVVDFFKENKVAVVPSRWIIHPAPNKKCYWPSGPGCSDLQKKANSQPREDWPSYPTRILKYYSKLCKIYVYNKI